MGRLRFKQTKTIALILVAQPPSELGRRATELLLDRLAGDGFANTNLIELPTKLIVRTSSAPPRVLT